MTHPYDSISRQSILEKGSLKWTAYPGAMGAWVAEMDFGVAPAIREAYHRVDAEDFYGYPPKREFQAMQEATAEYYAHRYGWQFEPSNVAGVGDVLAALSAVINIYTPPGAKIVLPTPAYMPFLQVPIFAGREIVQVPLHPKPGTNLGEGSWEFDFDGLDRALATAGPDGGSGGLLIMCNPHNPIGKVYTPGELERIAQIVDKHAALVFNDEIHAPLVYKPAQHFNYPTVSPAAAAHTITATSHSKSWNTPGLKCAQIIFSNPDHLAQWNTVGTFISNGVSNPGLRVAVAAYRDSRDWLDTTRDYLQRNRDALTDLLATYLPGVGYILPQGTYLTFLNVAGLDLAMNPQKFFLEHAKVALTDGSLCGDAGADYVRLNLGTPLPILTQMIRAMGEAVTGLRTTGTPGATGSSPVVGTTQTGAEA